MRTCTCMHAIMVWGRLHRVRQAAVHRWRVSAACFAFRSVDGDVEWPRSDRAPFLVYAEIAAEIAAEIVTEIAAEIAAEIVRPGAARQRAAHSDTASFAAARCPIKPWAPAAAIAVAIPAVTAAPGGRAAALGDALGGGVGCGGGGGGSGGGAGGQASSRRGGATDGGQRVGWERSRSQADLVGIWAEARRAGRRRRWRLTWRRARWRQATSRSGGGMRREPLAHIEHVAPQAGHVAPQAAPARGELARRCLATRSGRRKGGGGGDRACVQGSEGGGGKGSRGGEGGGGGATGGGCEATGGGEGVNRGLGVNRDGCRPGGLCEPHRAAKGAATHAAMHTAHRAARRGCTVEPANPPDATL